MKVVEVKDKVPVGFLEESTGSYSVMRLMSLLSLFASFGCTTIMIVKTTPPPNMTILTVLFLVGAFIPKVAQKFAEAILSKNTNNGTKT